MIRWREEKECYRLESTYTLGGGGGLVVLGVGALLFGLSGGLLALRTNSRNPEVWSSILVFLLVGAGAIGYVKAYLREATWVEIAVRGKRVRWGGGSGRGTDDFIEVTQFLHHLSIQDLTVAVHARLPDGSTLPVLQLGGSLDVARADRLVAQMNELLCTDGR